MIPSISVSCCRRIASTARLIAAAGGVALDKPRQDHHIGPVDNAVAQDRDPAPGASPARRGVQCPTCRLSGIDMRMSRRGDSMLQEILRQPACH